MLLASQTGNESGKHKIQLPENRESNEKPHVRN